MIFSLLLSAFLVLCAPVLAAAEYILRLPGIPEIRFQDADVSNVPVPFVIANRPGERDWTQGIDARDLNETLARVWSVIRPKEKVLVELRLPNFSPDFSFRDHRMIFYATRFGELAVNGKRIAFPYSQMMIDKSALRFVEPYRRCFRDITPREWKADEPHIYGSVAMTIRGVVDRLETDEPFVWEGKIDSVRFMDAYLRDIEVLKIDCK